nr:MAG TPA: hypothetical protein [Bacteriophage sp.]
MQRASPTLFLPIAHNRAFLGCFSPYRLCSYGSHV